MQFLPAYRRPLLQRAVAALSLVGFLAAVIGVPIIEPTSPETVKDLSQPFPCQHSACGCRNATMCWRACCCNTNKAKLAWAKKNGVKPPAFVAIAAAKDEATLVVNKPSCCATKTAAPVKSCCSNGDSAKADLATRNVESPGNVESSLPWRLTLVNAVAARQCQGLDQLWLIFSAAAPPPVPVKISIEEKTAELSEPIQAALVSVNLPPDSPPPKA
ncbi:hypothetical protein ETAA8_52280 [Anatilimnocola aggregata]|uniref:Uncharacterized protein n=1 Tax=Anatilimnocola aggregata TaxID=2528021 RepID=A0A517YIQ5_9BACT|nr:hypothetical protein [Anatilimnocola aggregata]QDU30109.1 hypothetical protein ETAA8_52280 [Anatilimnocola aggregata]